MREIIIPNRIKLQVSFVLLLSIIASKAWFAEDGRM